MCCARRVLYEVALPLAFVPTHTIPPNISTVTWRIVAPPKNCPKTVLNSVLSPAARYVLFRKLTTRPCFVSTIEVLGRAIRRIKVDVGLPWRDRWFRVGQGHLRQE